MPALKPLSSPARLLANRANAAKSTGPRTEEGKARSRGNACKHGLTGSGVALPTEDAAAVLGRFEALRDQFQPTTPLGEHYVGRIALATVRLDRAARQEAAALALRVAHAAEQFDADRRAGADSALGRLRSGEARAAWRDLIETPEGIVALVTELAGLRRCLGLAEPLWSNEHGARLDACLGIDPDPLIPSRVEALTGAALGSPDLLDRRDGEAITATGRPVAAWALAQLAGLIDREIAALREEDAAIDREAIARDRAGAADRALFDPSPAATLVRRYEAAAAREVDRSLRLFLEVEATAPTESNPHRDDATPSEVPLEPETPPADAPEADDPGPPYDTPSPITRPIEEPATIALKSNPSQYLTTDLASFGPGPSHQLTPAVDDVRAAGPPIPL